MRVHFSDDNNSERFSQTLMNIGNKNVQANDNRIIQLDSSFANLVLNLD